MAGSAARSSRAATVGPAGPANEATSGGTAGTRIGLARLQPVLAARAPLLLGLLILLYTAVFTGLNVYRARALRQGFDFLVYEQPIWNTVHGRPFEQSMYSFASTHLGVDLALFELWVAPFYALWQSPVTLFFLISLGAGLGALPLFLLARERYRSALVGLGWAALYLLFLPVGTITLDEFQPRLFAATALLGAYWFYRRGRAVPFWICLALAITVRSDVGLIVAAFGLYGLVERRSWRFSLAPLLVGLGYWAVAVFLLIPALAGGHAFLWQINYSWLGTTSRQIVTTIVTHPLYTARGVFTLEKLRYLAQLLWPLAFLPLLRPRLLLIPLPMLGLNLLSERVVQFDLYHQYQALIVPFLVLAALYGLADLLDASRRTGRVVVLLVAALAAAVLLLPVWSGDAGSRNGLHPGIALLVPLTLLALLVGPAIIGVVLPRVAGRAVPLALAVLTGLMLLQYLALDSEVIRFLKQPGPSPRLAPARALIARIPPDAPLAVTSQLAIHVPLRQQLYHFPGNDSYDPALVARARYVLGDRWRSPEESAALDRLIQSGVWRVVAETSGFVLLERR